MRLTFACALRDALVERARRGDAAAIELLLQAVPSDLPPAVVRDARDDRLRAIASTLAAACPGVSARRVAAIIELAGDRLSAGHVGLGGARIFDGLTMAEFDWLAAEVRELMSWLPDGKWPRARQIFNIVNV